MHMSGIGIVVNPRSRLNQRDPRAALRLARKLGDQGVVRTAKSRDDLARIAEDFRKLQIDVLGISGGDGTNYVTMVHVDDVAQLYVSALAAPAGSVYAGVNGEFLTFGEVAGALSAGLGLGGKTVSIKIGRAHV